MVVLWIPNSLTSLANFSFSLKFLKTCPWWYATFIIPFFFVLIISSYHLIIFAAFSESCTLLLLYLNRQILGFRLWSSNLAMAFLPLLLIHVLFFFICRAFPYKQKINTLVPNLKQKYLSKLVFCKFWSKKLPHLQSSLLFHILLLRYCQ